jgi:DNA invertase Pin-like site-specific DNA recombinase
VRHSLGMAFKHNRIGILVATKPEAAQRELRRLFAKHGTLDAVAKSIGVDRHTIPRWIRTLDAAGYGDPRVPEPTS